MVSTELKNKLDAFCVEWIGTWYGDCADDYDDAMDFCDVFFHELLNEIGTAFDLDFSNEEECDAARCAIVRSAIHVKQLSAM